MVRTKVVATSLKRNYKLGGGVMKKNNKVLIGIISLLATIVPSTKAQPIPKKSEFNRLNWVSVSQNHLATQIMFDFSEPIYFQKKLNKTKRELKLFFPGMKLADFNKKNVLAKFNKLKTIGLVQKIDIQEKHLNIPNVILTLTFASHKQIKNKNTKTKKIQTKTIPNRLLIKWSKINDPNRLILDIYSVESLEHIKNKNHVVLQAHHNPHRTMGRRLTSLRSKKKSLRIIIDPGHGGRDRGTTGVKNLMEKDITLCIAQKTSDLLKKKGYTALLTRSCDKYVSIVNRCELADKLNADLYVSIHANAWPYISTKVSGVETFYLRNKGILPPNRRAGFFFINAKPNKNLITLTDSYLRHNIASSKKLAHCVQNTLVKELQNYKYVVKNRGAKPSLLKTFTHTTIPTALVEVGFLTHPQEAKRLASAHYQNILAQGICKGITQFANKHLN